MRAAFNLALYHEMQGEFETATTYLDEAANLAKPETFEAALIASYRSQLAERMTEVTHDPFCNEIKRCVCKHNPSELGTAEGTL